MGTDEGVPSKALDDVWFDEFYDRALPVVFGYLLRLCGGDREQAWDLTQDSWVDGIPVAEIAELLGSSVSSTYSLLARARDELRSHLTGDPT